MFHKDYILFYNGKNKLSPKIKHPYTIIWNSLMYMKICGTELATIKFCLTKALFIVIKYVTPLNFTLYVFHYIMHLWTSDTTYS